MHESLFDNPCITTVTHESRILRQTRLIAEIVGLTRMFPYASYSPIALNNTLFISFFQYFVLQAAFGCTSFMKQECYTDSVEISEDKS